MPQNRNRVYYGWVIVSLSILSLTFWFGLRTTFSIFFVALIDHFRWGRAEAAASQSIALFVYMLTAPVIGTFVDRVGPRKTMVPGIVLTGLGLLLCTQIQTLFQFYCFYGIMVGVGITCLSVVPFTVILSHWFERKRGIANGLATVGMGIAPLLFIPSFQYMISSWGWRSAFLIFSLLVFAIPLPLNALFLRHRPEELGLLPDGDLPRGNSEEGTKEIREGKKNFLSSSREERRIRDLVRKGRFWSLLLFPCLTVFGTYVVIVHHVRYLVDLGVDKMWAASLYAAMGTVSVGFRFFWGWFSDRIGREITFTLGGICISLGIVFLMMFQTMSSTALLYLFAFLFGAGWGSTAPMFMSIAADLYEGRNFGLIYGMLEGGIGIGAALGTWVAGYIFDQTQNYFWAFVLGIFFDLVAILLVWIVAPRKARSPTMK